MHTYTYTTIDLSFLQGKNRLGLKGEKSRLFFDYVRILNELEEIRGDNTVFFLFENVASMFGKHACIRMIVHQLNLMHLRDCMHIVHIVQQRIGTKSPTDWEYHPFASTLNKSPQPLVNDCTGQTSLEARH